MKVSHISVSKSSCFFRCLPVAALLAMVAVGVALPGTPLLAAGGASAPLPTLQGEAALAYLKEEGLDGSLAKALAADGPSLRPKTSAQQAYLKASNSGLSQPHGRDRFGFSVAVSDDTLVIGAPSEDSNATGVDGDQLDESATESGAAYVFVREAGVWSQQAYLKASNTETFDQFGIAVAISGDTIVVGANGEDSGATGVNGDDADNSLPFSGAAYVFVRNAGVWSQEAYLKASNTGTGDFFGESVAVSGDTIVVGARGEDSISAGVNGDGVNNSRPAAGAAYVFVRDAGVWSQQAYLKASNPGFDDQFGNSVAVSGDTAVVGSVFEDGSATGVNGPITESAAEAGAAYVFERNAGVWSQQAYLKASNTGAGDRFGWSVAVSDDTLVIGAPTEDSNATGVDGDQLDESATNSGAAYVFARNAGVWSQQAYLKASNAGSSDLFGLSIAVSGDSVVVGAPIEAGVVKEFVGIGCDQSDNSAFAAGAAYSFRRAAGTWSQLDFLKASITLEGYRLGTSVAIEGNTAVVGAPGEDSNATGVDGNANNRSADNSGAAYVFTSGPVNTPPTAACQDVTVRTDEGLCSAGASIDAGSSDPDGDPITVTQDPPGPYGLGDTLVTLTATDDGGASDSCQATVTVEDQAAPIIWCNAPATITPPDAPVSFTATAEDNCSVASVEVTGYDCWKTNGAGKRVDKTGSCVVTFHGDTVTIEDSGGVGDRIEWTVTATDGSGNPITMSCSTDVVNPGKGKGKSK